MREFYLFIFFVVVGVDVNAQISGIKTIPGDYASITAAVTALNASGVGAGGVTFNVAAGNSETAPVGGINLTATGTAANPIIFQKSGAGANPVINAFAGTVSMIVTSTSVDGIFSFNGSDYITINGIDLADGNSTAPGTMEYGYGLFKTSATDGCQNNTIKNCTITLKASNNAPGPGQFEDGSRGIFSGNLPRTALTSPYTITATSGRNDNNTFSGNTIKNCFVGILIRGYIDGTSPYTYLDQSNTIGGSLSSDGNIIQNFGGSAGTANGIKTNNQNNVTVQYNSINNTASGGVAHVAGLNGIFVTATNATNNATSTIKNNTVTLSQGVTASLLRAIGVNNNGGTGTITISDNTVTSCTTTPGQTGAFTAIENTSTICTALIIQNNSVTNNTLSASGVFNGITNSSAISSSVNISSNSVTSNTSNTTSTSYGIVSSAGAAATVTISNNSVNSNTFGSATTTDFEGISFTTGVTSATLNSNTINNNTLSGTGNFYCINTTGSSSTTLTVSSNTVSGNQKSGSSGDLAGIRVGGGASTSATASNNYIYSNSVSNTSGTTAVNNYGIYNGSSPLTETYNANKIYSLSIGGTGTGTTYKIFGIYSGTSSTKTITQDSIYNLTVTGTTNSDVYGIYNVTGGLSGSAFSRNLIYNLSAAGTGGIADGIYCNAGTITIHNNMISNLSSASASAGNAVAGIYINGGTSYSLYYNSIYLNATSSGATFGTSGVYANTTPTVTLSNNLIINTSTVKGAARIAAYRRSDATLTSYSTSSNNNLLYAGTPSATNLLYVEGVGILTNPQQTLAGYKTYMSTRDQSSITGTVTFTNTATGDLHTSDATVQNKGQTIATATTDYDGQNRKPSCGGTDIGADEEYVGSSPATYNLWTGNTDTKWCTVCNWDNEAVPTSSDSVVIATASSGNYPLLNTAAVCGASSAKGINISGSGSLTIQAGGSLAVYGSFVNAGTFSHTGGDINFASTSYQAISSTSDLNFYNATFSGGGVKGLSANATVSGTLGLTSGVVSVSSGKYLALPAGVSYTGGGSSSYISGTLRKYFSSTETNFTFPVGDASRYGSVTLNNISAPSASEYMDVSYATGAFTGDHRNILTPVPAAPTNSIQPVVFASYVEYWNMSFSNTSSAFKATMTLNYSNNLFSQLYNRGADWLRVTRYDGAGVLDYGNDNALTDQSSGSSGSINSAQQLGASVFSTGSIFTFGTTANGVNPLPVVFKFFNGSKKTGYNQLQWQATCNTGKLYFTLERSSDKRYYEPVYKTSGDALRCSSPFDYHDYAATTAKVYYRVKITDDLGKTIYSPVVLLINKANGFEITGLLPNPATDVLYLNISTAKSEKLQLLVTDVSGKQVMTNTVVLQAGSNLVPVQIKHLSTGVYSISGMYGDGKIATLRFIKQ